MGFAVRMAWREMRGAWRHFFYFFSCIAMGVGAVVAIGLFASNVERAVTREARGLLGGDVEVRVSHALSEVGQTVLQSVSSRGVVLSHASELVAMAATVRPQPSGLVTQIVELKAIDINYPLYGSVKVDPSRAVTDLVAPPASLCRAIPESHGPENLPLASALSPVGRGSGEGETCYGAVVQESLLIRMGLSIGDRIKLGQAQFVIAGVLKTEPDRMANMFSLGPRVMISRAGLEAAELVKLGSRVRHRYLLKLPASVPVQPLLYELRGRLAGESARVSSYRDAQPQLKQFLDQLARYLGLVGLTALFVGGIGVAMTVQAFLKGKLQGIAILKTLGAESRTIAATYLLQAIVLAAIGSLAGVALGIGLQTVLPRALAGMLETDLLDQVEFSSTLSTASLPPILKGIGLGLLTTLLFTLWPILEVRKIRPVMVMRRAFLASEANPAKLSEGRRIGLAAHWPRLDLPKLLTAAVIVAGLAGLAMWQAGSWKIGLLFLAGLLAGVSGLLLGATGLIRLLKLLPVPRIVSLRHAVGNLSRPGSQVAGIVTAIGIGVMVIATVSLIERSLVQQIGEKRPADAPTFFFIDIQPDQAQGFARLIHSRTGEPAPQLTPLVRSRLHSVNGQRVKTEEDGEKERETKDEQRRSWYFTREYVLTFLETLPKDNVVTRGAWWTRGQAFPAPLVSVEEEAAKHLGLDIGSTVTFEIQGATITAQVSSIRKVEWGNFSTNFYMVLSPGALEGAPFTYVATVRVPPQDEVSLQQAVVAAFPNVTAINIGEVLDSFARILDRLSLAIRAVALFCVGAASLVMVTALAATRYRRLYEAVVLKALGATRGLIARSFAVEYALMGTVAGVIGIVLASSLSWAALRYVFDLSWSLQAGLLLIELLAAMLLTLAIGFLSTYRLLGMRPLAVLRQE